MGKPRPPEGFPDEVEFCKRKFAFHKSDGQRQIYKLDHVLIFKHAVYEGHKVTLLGNSMAKQWYQQAELSDDDLERFSVVTFKTFEDLEHQMRTQLEKLGWDVVIHSAAISDYKPVDVMVYHPAPLKSILAEKVSSSHPEIYIKCVQTPKLVDSIRDWGLGDGKLVKFKLEVNVSAEELFNRANKSRADSDADFIVANRLDDFSDWAEPSMQIIDRNSDVVLVSRKDLPKTLINKLEVL